MHNIHNEENEKCLCSICKQETEGIRSYFWNRPHSKLFRIENICEECRIGVDIIIDECYKKIENIVTQHFEVKVKDYKKKREIELKQLKLNV